MRQKQLHSMTLYDEPFRQIENGEKTFELRLYDEKRKKVQIGDYIYFTNADSKEEDPEIIAVKVLSIHRYPDFEALYNNFPLLKCGYTKETINNAGPEDMLDYYEPDLIEHYGVVAIEIELCKLESVAQEQIRENENKQP